ncbi:MAG TPA: divalent-cation tolerance protein CutA [Verrucomicrobiae bacterium]|jgi:periplasmic divalent cation tolerance protein
MPSFAAKYLIALVTAPDMKTARALARNVLESKLAACVNIVPRLESHYWWQGKIETGSEVLLLIKTEKKRLVALQKAILAQHPYDTAEFVVLPIADGSKRYLDWISASLAK